MCLVQEIRSSSGARIHIHEAEGGASDAIISLWGSDEQVARLML